MVDAHCHIDLYPDPSGMARHVERSQIATVAVTNLPSAYLRAEPHVTSMKFLRLALGMHPLTTKEHRKERKCFAEIAKRSFYIGEVGLDFSPAGISTKDAQVESFEFVLSSIKETGKFVTLHSRRAEAAVLEMVSQHLSYPVVFHWYSGSASTLNRILDAGHFFSINPAMTISSNGQKIIKAIPPERMLTETDGPFVKYDSRIVTPSDIAITEEYLASIWTMERHAVSQKVNNNFKELLRTLR